MSADKVRMHATARIVMIGTFPPPMHGMAVRLRENYRGAENVTSVSNAVLLMSGDDRAPEPRSELRTIGYLSNICTAKGIHPFLDVCEAARDRGLPVTARLAGPFQDAEI